MVVIRVTEEERCSALGAHSGVTPGNYLSSLKRQGTSVTENICAGVTLERVLGVASFCLFGICGRITVFLSHGR